MERRGPNIAAEEQVSINRAIIYGYRKLKHLTSLKYIKAVEGGRGKPMFLL